jgi:hypothetical protein
LRPAEKARFKDEVAAVLDRAAFLMRESPGKPAFFGEYGLARDDWQPSPYSDEDSAYLHLHNGLWASALSGLAGTVHPWWWENLGKHDGYRHYRAVAAFMADVPLGQVPFEPLRIKTSETRWRAVGLATLGQTYFWLSDSQATWHRQTVEKQPISESHGVEVSLDRLEPGTYRVTWWHTQTGETLRTQDVATDGPTLRLLAPDFTSDLACKARRIGVRSKYSTNGLEHGQQGSTVIYTDYVSYR